MRFSRCDRGVGIVAVIMIVAVLSVMGAVVTLLVATGAVSKTNDLVREQAFELGTAGIEYALKRIDEGSDPDGDTRYLGAGRFTVAYSPAGLITITSDVSAMMGSAAPTFTVQGPVPGGTMADCLTVDVSGASMDQWWPYEILGAVLRNTCQTDVVIASMTVTWTPASANRTVTIRLGNTDVYNNWPGIPAGTPIDIADYTIPSCGSRNQTRIRFDDQLPGRNFTVVYAMSDGSNKSAFYQFVANNEAACLNVDLSASYVGSSGYTRLNGGTLTNACEPPTVIGIRNMAVTWAPLTPSRQFTAVGINGNWMWDGSAGAGDEVNFWGDVLLNAGESVTQDFLRFSSDMRGYNYPTITYVMRDGTIATASRSLYETSMGPCLSVNTGGTSIGGSGNRDLLGESLSNTCALGIVLGRIRTNWSGVPANRRLTAIRINGADVWTGSVVSGYEADISDIEIPGGGMVAVDRYRWNSSVAGGSFSHVMRLWDNSTVNVPSFSP